MLSTQPFFIKGVDDVDQARSNAFGAMLTFVVTFVVSVLAMMRGSSAEEGGSGIDVGKEGYSKLNIDLSKDYGSSGIAT
ncbi:hypothetical protein ACHAXS_004404 [Conticribra weissflogii]